jgi:hypothetical protein
LKVFPVELSPAAAAEMLEEQDSGKQLSAEILLTQVRPGE